MSPSGSESAARLRRGCGPIVAILRCFINEVLITLGLFFQSTIWGAISMARNDIRLDQINARLGDMSRPRQYDEYGDEVFEIDDDSAKQGSGFGFIFAMVAFFAGVTAATFFYASGVNPISSASISSLLGGSNHYKSVASSCEQGWVPRAQNDLPMLCYLTTSVSRLCDPDERSHLARVYKRYKNDRSAYEADRNLSGLRAVVALQTSRGELQSALQSTFRNIQANIDGKSSGGISDDPVGAVFKKINNAASGGEAGRRANAVQRVSDSQIVLALRHVGAAGYMSKWDYGWFADGFVADAYDGLDTKVDPCKK
jgi:hypothetical protein